MKKDLENIGNEFNWSTDKFGESLSKYFSDLFNDYTNEPQKVLKNSLTILISLIICLTRGKFEDQYICAIDNIEYLLDIKDRKITTAGDLEIFAKMIEEAKDDLSKIIGKLQTNYAFFTMVLVTRDSTYTFIRNSHNHFGDSQMINISAAVDFGLVVEKRKNSLKIPDDQKNNVYIKMFETVMEDNVKGSKWAMYNVIKTMCNSNFRQISLQLANIILDQNYEELKWFLKNWNNDDYTKYKTEHIQAPLLLVKTLFRKNFF
jgi:hypothetical protein